MGSGHDWQSDAEIAAEQRTLAKERDNFQTFIMKWFDETQRLESNSELFVRFDRMHRFLVEVPQRDRRVVFP